MVLFLKSYKLAAISIVTACMKEHTSNLLLRMLLPVRTFKLAAISYDIVTACMKEHTPWRSLLDRGEFVGWYGEMEALEERNLLEFSRQIEAGMVSEAWMY